MRILLAHNYYRSSAPSGEDAVFRNEKDLLLAHHEVEVFERFNDNIDESTLSKKIQLALSGAWSAESYRAVRRVIASFKPDVAHFHNTFPLISPSAYAACHDERVPVVQTLHNFRFVCPNAMLQRDGHTCEDCLGTSLFPALRYRCYRGSLSATGAQVWTILRNRWHGTYWRLVDRYIALTGFSASKLVLGGLPEKKISVRSNFLPNPPCPGGGRGGYVVYVGRLSAEKGIRTLLEAWRELPGIPLKILGDGPLRDFVAAMAAEGNQNIEFLGYCDKDRILEIVRGAAFQIVPSEWYEGFPMVILEAYACGTPVLASRIGSLEEVVVEGVTGSHFAAGNIADLRDKARALWGARDSLDDLRASTRATFDANYIADNSRDLLLQIYDDAIQTFRSENKGR